MYKWLVRGVVRAALARLRAGDPRWVLWMFAPDVHFYFPGQHSWAADLRGRDQVRPWLDRFVQTGLQLTPHEILVNGPPWRTVVCVRFTDSAIDADGDVIYRNEGVLFDRVKWGRVEFHTAYEDTQRVAAFDQALGEQA